MTTRLSRRQKSWCARAETGDLIIPIKKGIISLDSIYTELHEIVGGDKSGRTSSNEVTCWKAVGIAIEDAAVARLVYDKAKKEGIGSARAMPTD